MRILRTCLLIYQTRLVRLTNFANLLEHIHLHLVKQGAFEGLSLVTSEGGWGTDSLPEIAELVKQAALMGEVGIHQVEGGLPPGPAIMDKQFKTAFPIQATGFQGA